MRTLHKSLIALALAGVLALPLLRLDADASAPPVAADAPPAIVSVAPAVRTDFAPRHWSPGSIISRQDARVASELEGRVLQVAEVGQRVRAGQALAVLDDTALRLRERESEADLARIQAQLDLAARQEQRYAQLAAQQNIARAQYEQLRADRDVLAQDRARVQAQLAQLRHQRSQMVVRAPFDGIVAERHTQRGEYLVTGASVARLVDTAAPEVRVRAPVDLARHLERGTLVRVRSNGAERDYPVSALVPVGDEASRQLELRIAVRDLQAPVGTAVDVGLPSAETRSVVAVPRDAVILRREGDFVLRVDAAGKAERLAVKTGAAVDDLVEVSGDVRAGDRLIVRGGERVEPGQAVSVQSLAIALAMR
ncbi:MULTISPECIES: efflux RND transporter periplasmic adaptor subunit [unclassified Pseudoxanthomonas]|uniref:efflux RND transporter periplasmic adaptor subunit n=1 Tax=unclassified Pseudoxanthomonas TaxID=2645906 RepID=UPI0008F36FF3|nr:MULTISPECIES: efflux RND transporter periplasmic adaptor subunit [unclassified Pseudoxanthomonas]PPJ43887.1 efflux RND transporter periplasmic adaptor subunit [Pseudoxanthomonas sp. KAs_5_3]SFV36465.1 RND family efflux transporter, MFP subunit [Pseudoxanthomonas sp. YR558]